MEECADGGQFTASTKPRGFSPWGLVARSPRARARNQESKSRRPTTRQASLHRPLIRRVGTSEPSERMPTMVANFNRWACTRSARFGHRTSRCVGLRRSTRSTRRIARSRSTHNPKIVHFSHARYSPQKRCALHAHLVEAAVRRGTAAKPFRSASAYLTVAKSFLFSNTAVRVCVDISTQLDFFQKMLTRCGLITTVAAKLN